MPDSRATQAAAPPLAQIYFYLTEGCNCACRHCWLAPKFDPDATRYPTLPVAQFEQVLAEAKPLGLQSVKLTGGEPLMHPRIDELLAIVEREELGLLIETNGLKLDRELAALIARCQRRSVWISMDGATATTHDGVRGVPGAFERAIAGAEALSEAGVAPQFVFSVMRDNVNQIEPVVRLAEQLGVRMVKFNLIQPTERGMALHDAGDTLSIGELLELGRWVTGELAAATSVQLYYDWPWAFRPLSQIATPEGQGGCSIRTIIGVLASGHYALCGIGESVPELLFGPVGQVPLAEVWQSHEVLLALREGLPNRLSGVCGECLHKGICLGACLAQNYYRAQDLFAPFWFCDEADAQGLFPSSRRWPAVQQG